MKVTVSYNLFYNNGGTAFSARGGAIGSDGGLTTIEMHRNVFRNNGLNLLAIGGGGGRPGANINVGNRLQLTSQFDTFGEPSSPSPNIRLVGGRSILATFGGVPGDPRHCSLKAEFFHPTFIRDTPANKETPELLILGGDGAATGSGNRALVLIRNSKVTTTAGALTSGALVIEDETEMGTVPNTAMLIGSREDFVRLNQGLRAPAAKFFVKQ